MVDPFVTALGRYLRDTGTKQAWLAERLGCSTAKVSRWTTGMGGMSERDKRKVLGVLRERAALSLDGLLDDQPAFHGVESFRSRPRADGSPFEAFLAGSES